MPSKAHLFNAETGRAMALKSHAPESARHLPKVVIPQAPDPALPPAQQIDPFSVELACACEETLTLLRKTKEPQQRAQLARSLRDLHETWHLATGKPKPGQLKPDSLRHPRPSM